MKVLIRTIDERLQRLSSGAIFTIGLVYVLALGGLDCITPPQMSFTLLYLLGIAFVAWGAGKWHATIIAAAATALLSHAEWVLARTTEREAIILWNVSTHLIVLTAAAWLTSAVARLTRHLGSLVEERTARWKAEAQQHKATAARLGEALERFEQATKSVQEREQRYRAILATAMDGFAIVDPAGRMIDVNEAYCRIIGYPREELLGMHITQVEAAQTPQEVAEHMARFVETGGGRFETRQRRKDAREIDVEVSVSCPAGRGGPFIAFTRDITERKRTEEALRESEERYRSLAESSPDAIFIIDRQIKVRYANSAAAALWHRAAKDLLGLSQPELFPPHIAKCHADIAAQVFETRENLCFDERLPFPAGERWIESRVVPIRGPGGEVDSIIVISVDISERKQVEFLLRAQRDVGISLSLTSDLAAALDRLLEIVVQLEGIDCGGVYLLEPATGEMRLATHRGVSAAFVERVSRMQPDDPPALLAKAGQPVYTPYNDLPGPDPGKDIENLRTVAFLPLCHEGAVLGSLILASHTCDEIPARTRAVIEAIAAQAAGAIARLRTENALRQSETRLRTIITGAPVLLFAVDQDGFITFEEGKAIRALDMQAGANVGRSIAAAYGKFPVFLDHLRRALAGAEFSAIVEMGAAALDCRYSPTRDKDGNFTGFIGVATNITEQRRLERQILEISDREQARIGQEIHDGLCQQLVSLAFDANALESELASTGRREAAIAKRIADYLDQAITESRQLSRGLFPIRLETEGLPSALEELAHSTSERFGIPCIFKSSGPVIVKSHAMAIHLYRIAQEAVNNAIKHSRPGTISILLHSRADQIELRIEDNGAGLASELPDRLAGMGLHIMDYRARSIGGTLQVGRAPGGGTTVCCCAPCPRS